MTNKEAVERIKDRMFIHRMNEPRAVHITQAYAVIIASIIAARV